MVLQFPHFDPRVKPPLGTQLDRSDPINRGLVGCWLMNEGAGTRVNDLSGNGHAGTLSGTTWGSGPSGHCLVFSGVNQYVGLSGMPALGTGDFTLVAWCNHPQDSAFRAIIGQGTAYTGAWLFYKTNTDKLQFYGAGGALSVAWGGNNSWPNGVWFQAVAVRRNGVLTLYQNAVAGASDATATADLNNTTYAWRIGLDWGNNNDYAGLINSISVYNRALSPSEIGELSRDPFCALRPSRSLTRVLGAMSAGGTNYTRTISDGMGVVDGLGRASTFDRALTDGMGVVDDTSGTAAMIRSVAESIGLSDSSSGSLEAVRAIADTLGIADAMAKGEGKTIRDTLGLVDTVARLSVVLRQVSDDLGLADSANRVFQVLRTVADTLGITDAVSAEMGGIARIISDSLGVTDSMSRTHAAIRGMTEALGLTDTVVRTLIASRIITDSLGLTDNVVRGAVLTLADSLGISDDMTAAVAYLRAQTESLGLTDSVARISAMLRTVNESLGLADAVSYQANAEVLVRAVWAFLLLQKNRH